MVRRERGLLIAVNARPVRPFAEPERVPLRRAEKALADFGRTLLVAPHPDDESLACGGLLALLARAGREVKVLMVSDGAQSHPGSRRFPPPARRALRERETLAALAALGVADPPAAVTFLRLPDAAVPGAPGDPGFAPAARTVRELLRAIAPRTLLLPWRRDPHPDHRASFALARHALSRLPASEAPRCVEYPVWLWERGDPADLPGPGEVSAWRLDIADVLPRKLAAIAAHRSQTTDLIDDDPAGFRLGPVMLARFARPWELFLETLSEP